jgi:quinol monooxygenase YgiN
MPDPAQLLIARVHGVAVRRDELVRAAQELAAASVADEGCISFDVLVQPDAPSELVMVCAWRSDRDLRAHFSSPAYGRYVLAVTDLLSRPSDVTIYSVSGTVHPIADLSTEPQRAT